MEFPQLDLLAEKLEELLDRWRRLVQANGELTAECDTLRVRLEAKEAEIEDLRRERDTMRSRVDSMLSRLDESVA
ncbi:MAG: cell division protein ZapB [Pseudomonadota bacterium]